MHFNIGFSPCPNDTFIFDALVHQKIDTEGFSFAPILADVQTLNEWALKGKLALTKISYGVWPLLQDKYHLLQSGGALGRGVGPLLIAKKQVKDLLEVDHFKVAVPGVNTTAHLLFSMAFPNAKNKEFLVFNNIEDAVLAGTVDAGVIIHENRFTYQNKGLVKLMDLGENWEQKLQCPIPLGGIVLSKNFNATVQKKIDRLIRNSVEYAFSQYPKIAPFVIAHAQEMSEDVMRQHINLYVNDFSLELGEAGNKAVEQLVLQSLRIGI